MAMRSPVWTSTAGDRNTTEVNEVTSNGPRSASSSKVGPGVGRKNLIFTAAGHGLADQVNVAAVRVAGWLAGVDRSMAVIGDCVNPKFGFGGRFPTVTVW